MMNLDEIIMSLTEIADQPTEDGMVDGVCQQTIRDAIELINYQHEHIEAFLRDQEPIVRCKNCKHYDKQTGICAKGNTHGYADTWSCADACRR
jgi:hypothetical protein